MVLIILASTILHFTVERPAMKQIGEYCPVIPPLSVAIVAETGHESNLRIIRGLLTSLLLVIFLFGIDLPQGRFV